MINRDDKETYFPLSFNEQMSWLGEEIEHIIKTNKKDMVRDKNVYGFSCSYTIDRLFHIIKEDPKNIAVLREVERAEREWWAYVDDEPNAPSEDEIYTYWNRYIWAYGAELETHPISYLLVRRCDEYHEDEWIGIYDSLHKLKHAYEKAVRELDNEYEKMRIHTFNKVTGKWKYDIPYEILFPKKEKLEQKEYKIEYIIDHPTMFMFKQWYIQHRGYGDYICNSQILKNRRPIDEVISVKFKVNNSYEIFEEIGNYWGEWDACPDWCTMRDKAKEWYVKYKAELKAISHDTLVFKCRKLSKEEVDVLWDDICRVAPNSRDIADEDAIKERLWLNSEFTLWWD